MSEVTLGGGDVATYRGSTDAATITQLDPQGVRAPTGGLTYWTRFGLVAALTAAAYFLVFAHVVADALAGSRTAFLVAVPVLLLMIAASYQAPPRGVGDTESDWIVSTLVGGFALTGIHLLSERMPALAGLWRLQLLGIVVWFACVLAVMFGVRHAVRMWALWLFAASCVTPLPFLMTTAALGGSDTAAALVAAALGSIAVFLAGRPAAVSGRVIAAVGCFGFGAAFVFYANGRLSLLLTILVAAAVIPMIAALALARTRVPKASATENIPAVFRRTSPASVVVLAVIAGVLCTLNPVLRDTHTIISTTGDWADRAGLQASTSYPFIARYLGDGASLVRYDVPATLTLPAAAVDVMTAPNRAVLDDFADAVWYPTDTPVDYRPSESSDGMPFGVRTIHSNPDTATDTTRQDWYAVTWLWRTPDAYQRITVVVGQNVGDNQPPPEPAPLSLLDTSLKPALWVARQQPDASGQVDELVTRRATEVVNRVVGSTTEDAGSTDA